MADPRDALLYVLESEDFYNFYEKYLLPMVKESDNEIADNYDLLDSYIEKIKTPESYIAVLGVQGAGKTSLLNSLIFGDEVLPVEVEETTCIPTMIRRVYEDEDVGAEVHYNDGRVESIPLKREFIDKIVDNKYNPGNLMDARYVLCKVEAPILKEGFVFVDLPGVGSLTEKNEETTMRFLQKTNIGIFLLRTVPPITNSEAGFIKIAWPRLQESIFIQNLWAKETQEEVEDGMEHNVDVLRNIAEEQSTALPESIVPVNIAMATEGSYKKDDALMRNSGLKALKKHIRGYAKKTANTLLFEQTADFFIRFINKAKLHIEERVAILDGDQDNIVERFEEAKADFFENKQELEARVVKHCEDFLDNIASLKMDWLPEKMDEAGKLALSQIDRMPLTDMKEDDFRQSVREVFSSVFGILYKELKSELARTAENHVENLGKALSKIASINQFLQKGFSTDASKDPHAASGWSVALAGSVAPLVVTGPVGWGILGGAMLTGSLVRCISGATAHKRIMRGVRKAISDGKRQIKKEMLEEVEYFSENVVNTIKESVSHELSAYAAELKSIQADLQKESDAQETQIEVLRADLKLTDVFIKALSQV